MARNFTDSDEGKRVVTADGDEVGTVERVEGSAVHISPSDDLSRSVRRRLGWSEDDQDEYMLQQSNVDTISNDEIKLKKNL